MSSAEKWYPWDIGRIPPPWQLLGRGIRSFPPARLGLRQLWRLERRALHLVGLGPEDLNDAPASELPPQHEAPPTRPPLSAEMDQLLARSVDQSTARGREELFGAILHQLVPDEARIIAALADSRAAPLIHVHHRSRSASDAPLLQNASLIGRTASLTLPRLTPVYVSHLRSLGLVEIGPEDPVLVEEYEVLMAEELVRNAIESASGLLPPRIVRRTLRLSELGRELWEAANPIESRADPPR
jgi:abortive infection alpha-like protein